MPIQPREHFGCSRKGLNIPLYPGLPQGHVCTKDQFVVESVCLGQRGQTGLDSYAKRPLMAMRVSADPERVQAGSLGGEVYRFGVDQCSIQIEAGCSVFWHRLVGWLFDPGGISQSKEEVPDTGGTVGEVRREQSLLGTVPRRSLVSFLKVVQAACGELGGAIKPEIIPGHRVELQEELRIAGEAVTLTGVIANVATGEGWLATRLGHAEVV